MLGSKRIYLRPMELGDVPYKVQWINDPKVRVTLDFEYPLSKIETENWLRNIAHKKGRKDFIVCESESDKPIGYAGLLQIDYVNRKAESYLGIGNTDFWGKGLGLETKYLLAQFAFEQLNLQRVYSLHHDDNYAMMKINEKLGGKKEGVLRKDYCGPGGKFKDRIIYSILKEEFGKPV